MASPHMRPVLFSLLDHKNSVIRFYPSLFVPGTLPPPLQLHSFILLQRDFLSSLPRRQVLAWTKQKCRGAFLRRLYLVFREIFWHEINAITYQSLCSSVRVMDDGMSGTKM